MQKYSKNERMEIGRQIYEDEMTSYYAAEIYGINYYTAREYMRFYRDVNKLVPKDVIYHNLPGNRKSSEFDESWHDAWLTDRTSPIQMSMEELETVLAKLKMREKWVCAEIEKRKSGNNE